MARFVSSHNPVSVRALKRRAMGTVVTRHYGREDVRFTRVNGGWSRQSSERSTVVTSAAVARECNCAYGCRESWARVY